MYVFVHKSFSINHQTLLQCQILTEQMMVKNQGFIGNIFDFYLNLHLTKSKILIGSNNQSASYPTASSSTLTSVSFVVFCTLITA